LRKPKLFAGAGLLAVAAVAVVLTTASADSPGPPPATTPIQHLVVIFGENISFDHYFGTYPNATNPPGEPTFTAAPNTPDVNGLNNTLLNFNPNAANPQRLDRSEALTCDQDHKYGDEQKAADGGLMDKAVEFTNNSNCVAPDQSKPNLVMDYYDGNTVTGLWNYAQHFSLSDNSYDTVFGPSTPGALNLISGQTHGATPAAIAGSVENGSVIGDPDPTLDDCGSGNTVTMSGKNIGDLLNAHHLTWGWFNGGFDPTGTNGGKAVCGASSTNVGGATVADYSPHHEPFMYYASTANPHHMLPSSPSMIGKTDQANHQYDLKDFDTAVGNNNLPAVSFLKAPAYEDGHAGYSDPLDEQRFIVHTINELEKSPQWSSTAVVLAYDDSDGWYDHQMSPIVSPSAAPSDALNGPGVCGNVKDQSAYPDRCGYGPRLPLLVISPWAKSNFVDSSITDQSSIIRFVEDNWQLGRIGDQSFDAKAGTLGNMFDFNPKAPRSAKLFLDETTGLPVGGDDHGHGSPGGPGNGGHGSSDGGEHHHHHSNKTRSARVSCTTHRTSQHRVVVSCVNHGKTHGRAAMRFRIVRNGKVLATARGVVRGGKAKASLRSKKALSGRYTLRVSLADTAGVTAVSHTVNLR
jgi:phospholipase C